MTEADDSDPDLMAEAQRLGLTEHMPENIRAWFEEKSSWPGGPEGREQFWRLAAEDSSNDDALVGEVERLQDIAATSQAIADGGAWLMAAMQDDGEGFDEAWQNLDDDTLGKVVLALRSMGFDPLAGFDPEAPSDDEPPTRNPDLDLFETGAIYEHLFTGELVEYLGPAFMPELDGEEVAVFRFVDLDYCLVATARDHRIGDQFSTLDDVIDDAAEEAFPGDDDQ